MQGFARKVTSIGLAAGALLLATASAQAATKVHVHNHYDDHGSAAPGTHTCPPRPEAVDTQALTSAFDIGSDPSDNWNGSATVKVCIYIMSDDTWEYFGTETDTATNADCGSGTVSWNFVGSISRPDAQGVRRDDGVWSIAAGTGSGDFADIDRGGGTYHGTLTTSPVLVSVGAWDGYVFC